MFKLLVALLALVAALAHSAPVVTTAAPAKPVVDASAADGNKGVGPANHNGGSSWTTKDKEEEDDEAPVTGITSEPGDDDDASPVQSSPAEPAKLPVEPSDKPSTAEPSSSSAQTEAGKEDGVISSTVGPVEASDKPSSDEPRSAAPSSEEDLISSSVAPVEPSDKPSPAATPSTEADVITSSAAAAPTDAASAEEPSGEAPATPKIIINDTSAKHQHGKIPAKLSGTSAPVDGDVSTSTAGDVITSEAASVSSSSDDMTTTTVDAAVENSTTTVNDNDSDNNNSTAASIKPAGQKDDPRSSATSFTLGVAALAVLGAAAF